MFGEPETVYLEPKTAIEFGLIKKVPKGDYDACSFQPISINEDPGEIKIEGEIDGTKTSLTYKKEELTKRQKVFIGWVYLLTEKYETRKTTKKLASDYIKDALQDEIDFIKSSKEERWAFPYYLIARHELDISGIPYPKNELYRFLDEPKKYFVDFYKEILRQEKNEIRKVAVAKIAEKFHPEESWFINQICDDLYDQEKYDECITYLLNVRDRLGEEKWLQKEARVTLWKCYIKKKDYENALSVIQGNITYAYFQDDFGPLLRGITLTIQGDKYDEAIPYLEEVIVRDYTDSYSTYLASFYLIKCFLETRNITRLKQIISTLQVQEDTFLRAGAPLYYGDEVIAILEEAINSKDLESSLIAKLQAVLACLFEQFKIHPLAKDEKDNEVAEKASVLAKNALEYFPEDTSLNALYSNILARLGRHDEAMDYKIKSQAKEGPADAIYPNAELTLCSAEYRLKYPSHIAELFEEMDATPTVYIENYGFDSDIGVFWKKKMYSQIADLFLFVKPYITDYAKIGEISTHTGGGLFEIAYSLGESKKHKEAKWVYEKILETQGESSAVLNNLAIEYEKLGDLKKAKEIITKAFQHKSDDEFVERNYARLCGNKKPNPSQKPKSEEAEPRKKLTITFDEKAGNIVLGKKQCSVPIGSNQFQLCKALFNQPVGEWLNETDVVQTFYKEGPRSFYDAIRFVNERAEQVFKIKKLLTYRASRVQVRPDGIM